MKRTVGFFSLGNDNRFADARTKTTATTTTIKSYLSMARPEVSYAETHTKHNCFKDSVRVILWMNRKPWQRFNTHTANISGDYHSLIVRSMNEVQAT